jgi:hypothetical protein
VPSEIYIPFFSDEQEHGLAVSQKVVDIVDFSSKGEPELFQS